MKKQKVDKKYNRIGTSSIDYGTESITIFDYIQCMLSVVIIFVFLSVFTYLVWQVGNTNVYSDLSSESTEELIEWITDTTETMQITENLTNTNLTAGITMQMNELLKSQRNEDTLTMMNTEELSMETKETENVGNSYEINTEITMKIQSNYNSESIEDITESNDFEFTFVDYIVPEYNGFKSYMSYLAITNKNSRQYKLQREYAATDGYGIRVIDNRYCIAIGTHFNANVGDYVDLILEDGTVLECIVADIKDDEDTDSDNIFTVTNNCVSEFIVDTSVLSSTIKSMGDISYADSCFKSRVKYIRVYDYNIFDDL